MAGNPYTPAYMSSMSSLYGSVKRRDAKALDKSLSDSSIRTRWQTPILKKDIDLFYSKYKVFIDEAKVYRQRVLGYTDEAPREVPKTVLQLQQERARGYYNPQAQSYTPAHNPYAPQSRFSNAPQGGDAGKEDYVKRAFEKCHTASERLEMSKIVKKVLEANKSK